MKNRSNLQNNMLHNKAISECFYKDHVYIEIVDFIITEQINVKSKHTIFLDIMPYEKFNPKESKLLIIKEIIRMVLIDIDNLSSRVDFLINPPLVFKITP